MKPSCKSCAIRIYWNWKFQKKNATVSLKPVKCKLSCFSIDSWRCLKNGFNVSIKQHLRCKSRCIETHHYLEQLEIKFWLLMLILLGKSLQWNRNWKLQFFFLFEIMDIHMDCLLRILVFFDNLLIWVFKKLCNKNKMKRLPAFWISLMILFNILQQ